MHVSNHGTCMLKEWFHHDIYIYIYLSLLRFYNYELSILAFVPITILLLLFQYFVLQYKAEVLLFGEEDLTYYESDQLKHLIKSGVLWYEMCL